MSKTRLNQIAPADLVADFGVDGFRYHFLADTPFGPDGDFSYEGMVARYNTDLANNFGNLLARVATVVGKKCDGVGPAPRARQPARRGGRRGLRRRPPPAWARGRSPRVALEATWRLIRATNAHLEANEPWKAEPGPAVDAVLGDALEALRIVAVLASPAIPGTCARGLAPHRAAGRRRATSACPAAAAWGGYPGGLPGREGRRRSSPASAGD